MPTLTAEQITYVRMMSGDICGCDDPDDDSCYDVSDAQMQYLYDNQASTAPLCMSGDPLGGLVYWVMKARVRKAMILTNSSNPEESNSYSQKYTQIQEQLKEQASECGFGGGAITVGTFDLGLDVDCDTSEYAGRYPYGYWGGF